MDSSDYSLDEEDTVSDDGNGHKISLKVQIKRKLAERSAIL